MAGNDDENVKFREQAARFCASFVEPSSRIDAEAALFKMLRRNDEPRAEMEARCGMQQAFISRVMVLAFAQRDVSSKDIENIAQHCGVLGRESA